MVLKHHCIGIKINHHPRITPNSRKRQLVKMKTKITIGSEQPDKHEDAKTRRKKQN